MEGTSAPRNESGTPKENRRNRTHHHWMPEYTPSKYFDGAPDHKIKEKVDATGAKVSASGRISLHFLALFDFPARRMCP
jgi:hypothetical protein